MTKTDRWIVIPRWDSGDHGEGFQHYSDRDPKWIKVYRTLLSKDEFLTMTFHRRGILQSLWLEYAASNRQLRDNTLTLTRRLGQRVTRLDLESLNDAGFIEFSASAPLAPCYPRKDKRRKEEPGLTEASSEGRPGFQSQEVKAAVIASLDEAREERRAS